MTIDIQLSESEDSIVCWSKWKNKRCYVCYFYKTNSFQFHIKAYSKDMTTGFSSSKLGRGINSVTYNISYETLEILDKCKEELINYLNNKVV